MVRPVNFMLHFFYSGMSSPIRHNAVGNATVVAKDHRNLDMVTLEEALQAGMENPHPAFMPLPMVEEANGVNLPAGVWLVPALVLYRGLHVGLYSWQTGYLVSVVAKSALERGRFSVLVYLLLL